MSTKLTLTIDKEIIELAKDYASRNGRSLSKLIENYLAALVQKGQPKQELSPKVKKLLGAVKVPKDFDYKKELEKAILEKYSK